MVGPPVSSRGRGRQAFTEVNNRQDVTATSDVGSGEGSECGTVEFTKEEVEALLNEKLKGKKFDLKVNNFVLLSHEFETWFLGGIVLGVYFFVLFC
jgi:kinesin family protein C1